MLVYTDNEKREYRLQDCNGYELFRVDYWDGRRKYEVYRNDCQDPDDERWDFVLRYFWSLKEAREWARRH